MASNSKLWDIAKNITYVHGEVVVLSHRRSDGYPTTLEFGIDYFVYLIENDFVLIRVRSSDGIGWMPAIKIHKIYVLPKSIYRTKKIESLLNP